MQKCFMCGSDDNLLVHSRRILKNGTEKITNVCRKCNTARMKKYRSTPEGKKKVFAAIYRSTKKLLKRQNARVMLNYHLKKGHITKPDCCEMCKKVTKLEGHHDDYSKPLEVRWLCRPCHCDYHRTNPEIV